MGETIRKHDDLPGATRLEAQGLAWLAEAMPDGGAHTVPAVVGRGWIEEPRLSRTRVTARAAEAFGRALAVTHAAGAPAFGAAPPGWDGCTQMGRCDIRLRPHAPDSATVERSWGEFYAQDRLLPYVRSGRDSGALSRGQARIVEAVCQRLIDGEFGEEQPRLVREEARRRGDGTAVARTHGDLWCGNVLWVPRAEVESWAPERAGIGPQPQADTADSQGGAPEANHGQQSGSHLDGAPADASPASRGPADASPTSRGPADASPTSRSPADASPTSRSPADASPASRSPADLGATHTHMAGAHRGTEVVGVLIDPLAHGAHAETDLAALSVFGQQYLDRIVAGYDEVSPLAPEWRARVGLHQLHILMIHVHLFGGGYGAQAAAVARPYA